MSGDWWAGSVEPETFLRVASVLPRLQPPTAVSAPADWRVSGAVSIALMVIALLLMLSFWIGWRSRQRDDNLDAFDLRYYGRRFRRRTLTAGILGVLAVLVPLGSQVLHWGDAPGLSSVYWCVVLSLSTLASLLLAVDYYSGKLYVSLALANLRRSQGDLVQHVHELKARLTGEPLCWSNPPAASAQSSFTSE